MKAKDGDSILEIAGRRGTPEIVKMLRERGAKIKSQ
jgi:ankyrin repeat protein